MSGYKELGQCFPSERKQKSLLMKSRLHVALTKNKIKTKKYQKTKTKR